MDIKINVFLRDTRNGYSKVYQDEGFLDEDGNFHDFIWTEGNYSCDCNRSLFLYDHNPDKELPCNIFDNIIEIDKIEDATTKKILHIQKGLVG